MLKYWTGSNLKHSHIKEKVVNKEAFKSLLWILKKKVCSI